MSEPPIKWSVVKLVSPKYELDWLNYDLLFFFDEDGKSWVSKDQGMTFKRMGRLWMLRFRAVMMFRRLFVRIYKTKSRLLWPW